MKKKVFSVLATAALATFFATGSAQAGTEMYTVKAGDSLWKIASQHKLTIDELKELNGLISDAIRIDQVLIVPANSVDTQQPVPPVKQVAESNTEFITIIQAGKKIKISVPKTPTPILDKVVDGSPGKEIGPVKELSDSAKSILLAALDVSVPLLDTPYAWGGSSVEGFDCSGFIHYVFSSAGLDAGRTDTIGLYSRSFYVDKPVPGDLLFFENTYRSGISHAGIYLGDNKFIHAGSTKVEISSIESGYWLENFTGFKRFTSLD